MNIEALKEAHDLSLDGRNFAARQILLDVIASLEKIEPVAIADGTFNHNCPIGVPLYTHPQAREPLTDEQIEDEWERLTGHSIFGGDRAEGRAMYLSPDEVTEFARAIESAHGITGEQHGTR